MDNQRLAYLCDRLQKITEAVYRVTDLFSDKEPLKWELREKAISIFTKTISLKDKNILEKDAFVSGAEELINQQIVLLSLLIENKSAASINFEILRDEYRAVEKLILKEKETKKELIKLGSFQNGARPGLLMDNGQSNGQITTECPIKKKEKEGFGGKDRKEKILNILKEKKEIAVGELAVVFKDYSGKTIQRDLKEMAEKGVVRKEGTKRWRRYVLNNF